MMPCGMIPPPVFASISTAAKKPTIAQRALSSSTVRRYAVVTSSSWRGDSSGASSSVAPGEAVAAAAAATALAGQEETPATTAGVAATPAAPVKNQAENGATREVGDALRETDATRATTPAATPPAAAVSGDALRAALGGVPSRGDGPVPGGGAPNVHADPAAMARVLAGMQPSTTGGASGSALQALRGPGLHEVLTPETVGPLLRDESVRARLLEFLPDAHRASGSENLEALLRTPQFQSQLERFSAALQSGQIDLAQFGLPPGTGFGVAEFLAAIQAEADEKKKRNTNRDGDEKDRG